MTSFLMKTDARARRVAKDLKTIAAEFGVEMKLTRSQQTVAALYGYGSWNEMMRSIGAGAGIEDHELDAAALGARRRGQIAALAEAGIPAASAPAILDRLAPTGRTEADLIPVARIQNTNDYHPMRLMWTLGIDFDRDPDATYDSIQEGYVAWAKNRTLAPLDRAALAQLEETGLEGTIWDPEKVLEHTHYVVDVAAIAEGASETDAMDETWRPQLGVDETLYFHFGCHRFPSPFPDLGVEGCYIDVTTASSRGVAAPGCGDAPDEIGFTFVVSPDVASAETDHMMEGDTPETRLRENIRLVSARFSPREGDRLGACLKRRSDDPTIDAYLDAWRPYLPPLLNAGWNCFKRWKAGGLNVHDAVPWDTEPELTRKLERALTEKKKLAVAAEIAEDGPYEVIVRFVDRPPPSGDVVSENATAPYPRAGSGDGGYDHDRIEAIIEDALESWRPWGLLWHAEKAAGLANDALGEVDDLSRPDLPPAALQYLRASCLRMNALWELRLAEENGPEKKRLAVEQADDLMRRLPTDTVGLLPALVKIHVENGDEARARAAVAKYAGAKPSDALVAWSVALVDARFGPADRAAASLARAHALNPSATGALLRADGDPWSWFWRGRETPGGSEEADHIAALHGSAWRTVDGYRAVLGSVDRLKDGAEKHVPISEYLRRIAAVEDRTGGHRYDGELKRAEEILRPAREANADEARKLDLAREALAVSPLCVVGYIMIANYANLPPDENLLAWEAGVAAGAKMLGSRHFEEEAGCFWRDQITRGYMSARQGLAYALWERGRRDEAVDHLKEMLRLNPRDNQRLRSVLLPWLALMGRDAEAETLLKDWSEQDSIELDAMLMWTKTLIVFRRDPAEAVEHLVAAMKCNAHVPSYLFWVDRPKPHWRGGYRLGSGEEANQYALLALDAWSAEARGWVDSTLASLAMNPVSGDPGRTYFRH